MSGWGELGGAYPAGLGLPPALDSGTRGGGEVSTTKALYARPLEEYLTTLRKGAWLQKHGRLGKPKLHFFRVINHDTQLAWRSSNGITRTVDLARVSSTVRGQTTDVFKRNPNPEVKDFSFSLKYPGSDGSERSLDLICPGEEAFELWYGGLKAIVDNLNTVSNALAVAKVVGSASMLPPRRPGVSASTGSLAADKAALSLAAASQNLQPKSVMGRVSGDIGLPVQTRTPGDLWLWGGVKASSGQPGTGGQHGTSAHSGGGGQPGSARPGSARSAAVGAPQQQQAAALGMAPRLAVETKQLDVLKVAAGSNHSALISYGGELYTWGAGADGKLGHGTQDSCHLPQRVNTLWGRKVQSIRCSPHATAAVTTDNELFTWGDGSAGTLGYSAIRQYIPRRVPLPAGVAHVALGAYHAAAVTLDGRLFTWGDNLAGKLGHGNDVNTASPRFVEAFAGMTVLRAACGHWHTAAIVREMRVQGSETDEGHLTLGPTPRSSFGSSTGTSSAVPRASAMLTMAGALYTWGGDLRWREPRVEAGGKREFKRDTHRGCLGVGDLEGRLLPTRVGGVLDSLGCVQVVAGLNFTAVVGSDHRVYQAGELVPTPGCPWSTGRQFSVVAGALANRWVDELAAGLNHCAAAARQAERRPSGALTAVGQKVVLAWGRGQEGQLGSGRVMDSATPVVVEGLAGQKVQQVAAGANSTMAVTEHCTFSEEAESGKSSQLLEAKTFFKLKAQESIAHTASAPTASAPPLGRSATFTAGSLGTTSFRLDRGGRDGISSVGPDSMYGDATESMDVVSQSSSSELFTRSSQPPSLASLRGSKSMKGRFKALASDLQSKSRKGLGAVALSGGSSARDLLPHSLPLRSLAAGPMRSISMRTTGNSTSDHPIRRTLQRRGSRTQGTFDALQGSHESGYGSALPYRETVSEGGGSVIESSLVTGGEGSAGGPGSMDRACDEVVSRLTPNGDPSPQRRRSYPDLPGASAGGIGMSSSSSYMHELESRVAKLESLLAQRTVQCDELAGRLEAATAAAGAAASTGTGSGEDAARNRTYSGALPLPPAMPADPSALCLSPDGSSNIPTLPEDMLDTRQASLAAQQQMVTRRLQEAAAKEADIARREAEYDRRVHSTTSVGSEYATPAGAAPTVPKHSPSNSGPPPGIVAARAASFTAVLSGSRASSASQAASVAMLQSSESPTSRRTASAGERPHSPLGPRNSDSAAVGNGAGASDCSQPLPAASGGGGPSRLAHAARQGLSVSTPLLSPTSTITESDFDLGLARTPPPARAGTPGSPRAPESTGSLPPLERSASPTVPGLRSAVRLEEGGATRGRADGEGLQRRVGDTWMEEVDKGVFLCKEQRAGGVHVVRVRFSRRKFTKEAAEAWYLANRRHITERYAQIVTAHGSSGGGAGVNLSPTRPAGAAGTARALDSVGNADAAGSNPRLARLSPPASSLGTSESAPNPGGNTPQASALGWLDLPAHLNPVDSAASGGMSNARSPAAAPRMGTNAAALARGRASPSSSPLKRRTSNASSIMTPGDISRAVAGEGTAGVGPGARSAPISPRDECDLLGSQESIPTARSDSQVESEPRRGAAAAAAAAAIAGRHSRANSTSSGGRSPQMPAWRR